MHSFGAGLLFILTAQVASLPQSLPLATTAPSSTPSIWQPTAGSAKFQIILDRTFSYGGRSAASLTPNDADIFDLDLFDTSKQLISTLHARGKKVICYFNAGGSESWRPDYASFNASDKGDPLQGWRGENWLDIRSPTVWDVMKKRIELASSKGCDAIDPDNVDAYGDESMRGGGFATRLTMQDSITYIKKLATEARSHNLSTGLKNADAILPSVASSIQFAVNEECAIGGGACNAYTSFLKAGKPVFHIEYVKPALNGTLKSESLFLRGMNTTQVEKVLCLQKSVYGNGKGRNVASKAVLGKITTVLKKVDLDGFVRYCDGSSRN